MSSVTSTMSRTARNILVVGVSPDEFARVAPFLDRNGFDVDRFPGAHGAIELVSAVTFETVIVRCPLLDMPIDEFLSAVRAPSSACRRSPVVLLAAEDGGDAEAYIGHGANRVVDLEETENEIQRQVSSLLSVAPRKSARFVTRLEVKMGGAKDMTLCRTENISETGILVSTDKRYELGTKIHMELTVDGDDRPIVAVAEVVRHTLDGRDRVSGLGMRFLSFVGDSQRRFQAFLEQL